MRIAIDIDSTLHHYWDQFADAARRRFGVELSYEEQVTWEIGLLRPEQLRACVAETHCADIVLASEPYAGAVEIVARWHAYGHYIHITSHRAVESHDHTAEWLERIGLPFDDLHCSYDKISRCTELDIDLLIDDSPVTLARAQEHGILPATIMHPWNRELCEVEGITCAEDWPSLAAALAPMLGSGRNGSG